jgi:hypothetical protein
MERKLSVPGIHRDGIMRIHGGKLLSVSSIPQTTRNNLSDTHFKKQEDVGSGEFGIKEKQSPRDQRQSKTRGNIDVIFEDL